MTESVDEQILDDTIAENISIGSTLNEFETLVQQCRKLLEDVRQLKNEVIYIGHATTQNVEEAYCPVLTKFKFFAPLPPLILIDDILGKRKAGPRPVPVIAPTSVVAETNKEFEEYKRERSDIFANRARIYVEYKNPEKRAKDALDKTSGKIVALQKIVRDYHDLENLAILVGLSLLHHNYKVNITMNKKKQAWEVTKLV
jgi:hypothetical protein